MDSRLTKTKEDSNKKPQPVHQHYVPAFILRNFVEKSGRFFLYDAARKRYKLYPVKNTFAEDDFYTIKTEDGDDYEIERNLSKFERDVVPIFQKIKNGGNIELRREELEALRIFMTLLAFRSKLRKNQYQNQTFDMVTRSTIDSFTNGQNFISVWKKEIKTISKLRKYKQIEESSEIDFAIKNEFLDDYRNYYMTIVKSYGQNFILSDVYPTLECIQDFNGNQMVFHMIYPLSPTIAIFLNSKIFRKENDCHLSSIERKLVSFSRIKDNSVIEPKVRYRNAPLCCDDDVFTYSTKKIYACDTIYINCLILNEVRNNFIFNDREKLLEVIRKYKNEDGLKNNYDDLESALDRALNMATK